MLVHYKKPCLSLLPTVTAVMKELTAAQSRLQELQHDLKELREALHDTQDKLKSQEAHNKVITTGLFLSYTYEEGLQRCCSAFFEPRLMFYITPKQ